MGSPKPETTIEPVIDQILGYLNFASGNQDKKFLANLDLLFSDSRDRTNSPERILAPIRKRLHERLLVVAKGNETFRDVHQAASVIDIVFDELPAFYHQHHGDLLFHQSESSLYNSFFIGRAVEATLQMESLPERRSKEWLSELIFRLNDYLGHRPVATLESQKIEPYPHEWIRPVPLYIRGVGAAHGRYRELIEIGVQTLSETDPNILRAAQFDPERMDELAIDPRAFDFDHPINRRPNHHFGQWDEHRIGPDGFFRRFIVHQITLDSLLDRVENQSDPNSKGEAIPRIQLMHEAGAVLACTMLMASGISGSGPGAYDSNTTLASLLPTIAGYRDQFYRDLILRLSPEHRVRLDNEAAARHQPFGGARQSLNAALSNKRSTQLVNCQLATIFARMGYQHAADEQSSIVPVASARISCQIDCLLSSASGAIKSGDLDGAFVAIPTATKLLKRGIECGAVVDPWNILGFDAQYSLFPAQENSVTDHRVFELVELVERILALCSQLWSEAAAKDNLAMCDKIKLQFKSLVDWWRKFAAHEVMAVDAVDPQEVFDAAELVARALNLWHKGGAATGDISFWASHAEMFDSPKAFALVIDALMQRGDYSTSSALMVNWLGHADRLLLQHGDSSLHNLIYRWISEQRDLWEEAPEQRSEIWKRIRKFYDFLEANAEQYWQVPRFQVDRKNGDHADSGELDLAGEQEDPDEEEDLFSAAYEDVVYNDSTDDGIDGAIFESAYTSDEALQAEVDRVLERLEFLGTVASYWRIVASIPIPLQDDPSNSELVCSNNKSPEDEIICDQLKHRRQIVGGWIDQASRNQEQLIELLGSIYQYPLPKTGADHEAMVHYDRHRLYKESLLDRTISSCVETKNALRMMRAVIRAVDYLVDARPLSEPDENEAGISAAGLPESPDSQIVSVFAAGMLKKPSLVVEQFPNLVQLLHNQPLLYVPLSKGGAPRKIVTARVLQTAMRELLGSLPQLGLLEETYELTDTALAMERNHPIGRGAVTEFDELFRVAFTSMVHALVQSTSRMKTKLMAASEQPGGDTPENVRLESENVLFECIEMLTESALLQWLEHSKTLRLTVLEKVNDQKSWEQVVDFIQRYGDGLFTQQFLHLANVRAILHQGVDPWLANLERSQHRPDLRLFDEIDKAISRKQVVRYLTLILETVIENYNEYRDYNTTTTQSDRGELLFILIDFLRLRGRYERVCWNLRPVIWAHEILVRDHQTGVAKMWRRSLTERVGPEADKYLESFEKLKQQHSIRMESVGRRLAERFGHPMQIDRLKALVSPAMEDPQSKDSRRRFELLYSETKAFCKSPVGAGIDMPNWLLALSEEVEKQFLPARLKDHHRTPGVVQPLDVPIAKLREQLENLPRRDKRLE